MGMLALLRSSLIAYKEEAGRQIKIAEAYVKVKEGSLREIVRATLSNRATAS